MLCALHRSLVKPFEPSSRAAAFEGPKVRKPAASRSSTMPATSGASGPTTTKSIRRAIFEMLADGPRSVGEIAERLPVTRPAVSQHLRALSDAGLVTHDSVG